MLNLYNVDYKVRGITKTMTDVVSADLGESAATTKDILAMQGVDLATVEIVGSAKL